MIAGRSPAWQTKWTLAGAAVAIILSVPVAAGQGIREAGGRAGTFLLHALNIDDEPTRTIGSEPVEGWDQ